MFAIETIKQLTENKQVGRLGSPKGFTQTSYLPKRKVIFFSA
jgi:hypothetical protein